MSRPELIFWLIVVAALYGYAGWLKFREWRARRAEEQLAMERLMRRGFPVAKRNGWLPDDLQ